MKCARLAVGYAKDNYSTLISTRPASNNFRTKFSSARNQMLFYRPYSAASNAFFFNLLYSILKIALSRYSRVSYKKLNGWTEVGHWCFAASQWTTSAHPFNFCTIIFNAPVMQ